ncbi:hypothetical protein ABIE50_005093 [Chitinophaga sp. OAE865]
MEKSTLLIGSGEWRVMRMPQALPGGDGKNERTILK